MTDRKPQVDHRLSHIRRSIGESIVALYQTSEPDVVKRLHRERDGWCGFAEIENVGADRVALVMRPGGAKRLLP